MYRYYVWQRDIKFTAPFAVGNTYISCLRQEGDILYSFFSVAKLRSWMKHGFAHGKIYFRNLRNFSATRYIRNLYDFSTIRLTMKIFSWLSQFCILEILWFDSLFIYVTCQCLQFRWLRSPIDISHYLEKIGHGSYFLVVLWYRHSVILSSIR